MSPIVEMRDLRVRFKGERTVHALNGVDITLQAGRGARRARRVRLGQERHLARAAAHAAAPPQRDLRHDPRRRQDVLALDEDELEQMRGGTVSMIFQEPMLALDPVYTIGDQIAETVDAPSRRHMGGRPPARARDARSACASPPPSGGWRPIRTRCRAACASAP